MPNQLLFTLQNLCSLHTDRPVLVGVSGGPDSLCLLLLLLEHGYKPVIAHLDHGLRPDSAADSAFVEQFAAARHLPCLTSRQDVRAFARSQQLTLEQAARELRYRFLFQSAQEVSAQAVAVGHHADDQAETVLLHLLRGAGLKGLSGMSFHSLPNTWSETIPLVRPLLGMTRAAILDFLQQRQVSALQDVSNQSFQFKRNRIRHELLPLLEDYNPQIRHALWRTAELCAQDYAALEAITRKAWETCRRQTGAGYLVIDPAALQAHPLAIRRMVLRQGLDTLRPGLVDVAFSTIQTAVEFLENPSRSASCELGGGVRIWLETGLLWLATWEADLPAGEWPQISPEQVTYLPAQGQIALPGDWRLEIELLEATAANIESACQNPDPYQAYLDTQLLDQPLRLGTTIPGVRFLPLGMGGRSQKLADFFTNNHLPRRARGGWPLVYCGERIAWVPGFRLAHPFRVQAQSSLITRLELKRVTSQENPL